MSAFRKFLEKNVISRVGDRTTIHEAALERACLTYDELSQQIRDNNTTIYSARAEIGALRRLVRTLQGLDTIDETAQQSRQAERTLERVLARRLARKAGVPDIKE
jgi:hypothetical protein